MTSGDAMSGERWYHQPVMWLGIGILAGFLIAWITMIVMAAQYPDEPLPIVSDQVLKMPATGPPERHP
jgi:hypothetical protein